MFKWIETWGMKKCDSRNVITLDDVLEKINLPGTKGHKLKYKSVLELTKPVSNSPEDISDFLTRVVGEDYSLGKPKIEYEFYTGKSDKHYFHIDINYKVDNFLYKHKEGKNLFSATVKFKRDLK